MDAAWATTSNLNEAKYGLAGCGTTSAALCFGGYINANVDTTEIWNGTSWATTSSLNEAKRFLAGCSTTSAALCFGGSTGARVATTEIWDGSLWATTSSLNEAKGYLAGCGTTSAALCFGGYTDANVDTTEIWIVEPYSTLSDTCVDKNGNVITNTLCNIDILNKDDRTTKYQTTQSNTVNGAWEVNSLGFVQGTKVLVLFNYEGVYGGDTDIAGAKFTITNSPV